MVDVSSGRKVKRPNLLPALNASSSLIPPAGKQAEMRSYTPTYRENVSNLIGEGLKAIGQDNYYAQNLAKRVTGLAEWSPFGALTAADDASRAYNAGNYGRAALGAAGAIPMVGKGERVAVKAAEDVIPIIRAYHGSPHSFAPEPGAPLGRFSDTAIGTGEGAQAYGHGHYLAESEGVARDYRDKLSEDYFTTGDGKTWSPDSLEHLNVRSLVRRTGDIDAALQKAKELLPTATDQTLPMLQGDISVLENLKARGGIQKKPSGHMYEVNIAADPAHFLDWDKPLAEQHPVVQEQLRNLGTAQKNRPLAETDVGRELYFKQTQGLSNESATERLKQAGLPGIRYLDQGSRFNPANLPNNPIANEARQFLEASNGDSAAALKAFDASNPVERWATTERDEVRKVINSAGRSTRNYVVFDPRIIEIVKKYGIVGALGLGLISQQDADALNKALAAQGVGGTEPASQPRSPNILGLK